MNITKDQLQQLFSRDHRIIYPKWRNMAHLITIKELIAINNQ